MNKTFRKIVGGALAVTALMGLSACGSKTEDNKAEGKTYKVGIVQFVDDASLNQIEAAIEAELDAKAKELGVTFDYTLYNGQGDATTLNQIGAELVGKGVDLIVPIATPAVKIMQSATEDTEIPIVFSAVSDPVGSGIVDALDAPGGRITVKLWAGEYKAFVEILDQGRGIPPEDLENVKTKFYKGSNSVRGSGIGLALVDSIMTALDGTMDIKSTLGRGTVVTLGLPLYHKA